MYTETNFKSKKELKKALAKGTEIRVFQPNDMFHATEKIQNGRHQVCLEGPHYPAAHSWYATAIVEKGIIKSVK